MSLINYFRRNKNTAVIAKERLQIIISHERSQRKTPDYLPLLQKELVAVISKYVPIKPEDVKVALDRAGGCSVLELNIALHESAAMPAEVD